MAIDASAGQIAHVPPIPASAEHRWEADLGALDPGSVTWISAELPTRKLKLDFLIDTVEARIICAEPVQLSTSWENGGRIINHRMSRHDKLPKNSYLSSLLLDVNHRWGMTGQLCYDHVSIWSSSRRRLLDCASDPAVGIISFAGNLRLATPGDGISKDVETGGMTISPASTLPSGRWMYITPEAGGGSWIELRRSNNMLRIDCKMGSWCSHNVCGWSNHGHDDQ
jgi:hypothetical protein